MDLPLVDSVGPDLYRHNAFRILDLPGGASEGEIRRRAEELRLDTRRETDDDALSEAVRRLEDPLSRLVERVFSPWTASPRTALHNAAVEAHARALDHEPPDALGLALAEERRRLWQAAFLAWRAALSAEDGFWELLTEEADRTTVETVRTRLPAALLSINAGLAVRACHDGRPEEAAWHFTLVRESGFDQGTVETVLRAAVEADAASVRTLGERALLAATSDPGRAHEAASRLLDKTAAPLGVLATALPGDHPLLLGLRDETALHALRCTVLFADSTGDWNTALDLSDRIQPIAASDQATALVRENRQVIRSHLLTATCWFCERRPAVEGAAYLQRLYGEIDERVRGKVSWRTVTVGVPRCGGCRRAHVLWPLRAGGAGVAVTAAVLTLTAATLPDLLPGAYGVAFVLVLAIFTAAWHRRPRARITEFPPVHEYLDQGWKLGAKPPGAG